MQEFKAEGLWMIKSTTSESQQKHVGQVVTFPFKLELDMHGRWFYINWLEHNPDAGKSTRSSLIQELEVDDDGDIIVTTLNTVYQFERVM